MAKATATSLNLAVALSLLLLLLSSAWGRFSAHEFDEQPVSDRALSCEAAHGVKSGETCFSVGKKFNLTPKEFSAINPNLVCENLFVGQWVCVEEST